MVFPLEEALAGLMRRVQLDSELPRRRRWQLIRAIAPALVVGVEDW